MIKTLARVLLKLLWGKVSGIFLSIAENLEKQDLSGGEKRMNAFSYLSTELSNYKKPEFLINVGIELAVLIIKEIKRA